MSSDSWSGTRGGDIIDLDRYMRNTVRPTRPRQRSNCNPELVVDGGAAVKTTRARHKRYSHDSGLSDTSYSRHRRVSRPHRRHSNINESKVRESTRQDSSDSLRQFRAVCEQALLEQQRQIAHVAQLCEKLTQRAEKTERNERSEQKEAKSEPVCDEKNEQNPTEKVTNERASSLRSSAQHCTSYVVKSERHRAPRRHDKMSSDVSDITSSSRSTKDPRRKDKHRSQQCKTYKLIMSKLDELNRVFNNRAVATPAAARPASSTSVSVCDKLVSTDLGVTQTRRVSVGGAGGRAVGSRLVTQAFAVDIAPAHRHAQPKPHVFTESVIKSSGGGSATSLGDPRCGFDLEDPVHLYSQAKRLQTLTVSTRRGRSLETRDSRHEARHDTRHEETRHEEARSVSLCSLCRDYWRYLRQCLVPMFAAPEHCQF